MKEPVYWITMKRKYFFNLKMIIKGWEERGNYEEDLKDLNEYDIET